MNDDTREYPFVLGKSWTFNLGQFELDASGKIQKESGQLLKPT
jgi:hypothetical protein